jgi:hypothetical protein
MRKGCYRGSIAPAVVSALRDLRPRPRRATRGCSERCVDSLQHRFRCTDIRSNAYSWLYSSQTGPPANRGCPQGRDGVVGLGRMCQAKTPRSGGAIHQRTSFTSSWFRCTKPAGWIAVRGVDDPAIPITWMDPAVPRISMPALASSRGGGRARNGRSESAGVQLVERP